MTNARITKQKVFDTAKYIALKGIEPTTANVREYLAFTGSQTTLHKYLKEWKLKCFQSYGINGSLDLEQKDLATFKAEKQTLETTITKMEEHNKIVALEFAKTEKLNVELTQKLTHVTTQFHLLEKSQDELKTTQEYMEQMYKELKEERNILIAKMERDKDQLINSLREELKQSHQASLKEITDVSYNGHDALMQEKVKTINLEEKVKSLTEDLTKQQQEWLHANKMLQPLKTQIQWYQKFMSEVLTSEQLQEYEKKKQLLEFENN
jgi:chromosome segregation ATPase